MHDIKAIRQNPEIYDKAWARRGLEPQTITILDKDKLVRRALQVQQEAEAARNKASKQIGAAMGRGDKEAAETLKTEVAGAKNVIAMMGEQIDAVLADWVTKRVGSEAKPNEVLLSTNKCAFTGTFALGELFTLIMGIDTNKMVQASIAWPFIKDRLKDPIVKAAVIGLR